MSHVGACVGGPRPHYLVHYSLNCSLHYSLTTTHLLQPLQDRSFYVNTTIFNATTQRGALYSDETCETPLATAPRVGVDSTSLYFKPNTHEFSSGGPEWLVSLTLTLGAWQP